MLIVLFRLDYDPIKEQLVLRMPTRLHETFIELVTTEIISQLKAFASDSTNPVTASFAARIQSCGSSTINLETNEEEKPRRRDPDASFAEADAAFPSVILEVSYKQKRRALARLADDYVLCTDGTIQVMFGLDIEYRDKQSATLSEWRAQYINDPDTQEQLLVANQTITEKVSLTTSLTILQMLTRLAV